MSGYTLRFGEDAISVDVRDFGAKGDGVTDDTKAIRKAVRTLAQTKFRGGFRRDRRPREVRFPAGTYVVRPLRIPRRIVLRGTPAAMSAAASRIEEAMNG